MARNFLFLVGLLLLSEYHVGAAVANCTDYVIDIAGTGNGGRTVYNSPKIITTNPPSGFTAPNQFSLAVTCPRELTNCTIVFVTNDNPAQDTGNDTYNMRNHLAGDDVWKESTDALAVSTGLVDDIVLENNTEAACNHIYVMAITNKFGDLVDAANCTKNVTETGSNEFTKYTCRVKMMGKQSIEWGVIDSAFGNDGFATREITDIGQFSVTFQTQAATETIIARFDTFAYAQIISAQQTTSVDIDATCKANLGITILSITNDPYAFTRLTVTPSNSTGKFKITPASWDAARVDVSGCGINDQTNCLQRWTFDLCALQCEAEDTVDLVFHIDCRNLTAAFDCPVPVDNITGNIVTNAGSFCGEMNVDVTVSGSMAMYGAAANYDNDQLIITSITPNNTGFFLGKFSGTSNGNDMSISAVALLTAELKDTGYSHTLWNDANDDQQALPVNYGSGLNTDVGDTGLANTNAGADCGGNDHVFTVYAPDSAAQSHWVKFSFNIIAQCSPQSPSVTISVTVKIFFTQLGLLEQGTQILELSYDRHGNLKGLKEVEESTESSSDTMFSVVESDEKTVGSLMINEEDGKKAGGEPSTSIIIGAVIAVVGVALFAVATALWWRKKSQLTKIVAQSKYTITPTVEELKPEDLKDSADEA